MLSTFAELPWFVDLGIFAGVLIVLFFVFKAFPKTNRVKGQLLVLSGMCMMTLMFYLLTFSLRVNKIALDSGFTARTMPRVWCALMVPIAIAAYWAILKEGSPDDKKFLNWKFTVLVILGTVFSVVLFQFVGYYISSAVFLFVMMWVLKERRWVLLVSAPIVWVLFTYFVFQRVLYISLPTGLIFSGLIK